MIASPVFTSLGDHIARLADVDFWRPYVAEILARHGLADAAHEPVAGFHGTYPTFLCGEVVVKLFGYSRAWRAGHAAEQDAYGRLGADPLIAAPRLLGQGRLYDDADASWPYLVTTRMPGISWRKAGLSPEQRLAVVADLGRQIRHIHALRPSGVAARAHWSALDVAAAAQRTVLPPHLIAQIDGYLARLGPFDLVFTHADVVANHVFVENGRLAGLIDWGDAMGADRHYEIIQPHRDMFGCDKALLRVFLDASDWPVRKDFAQKALGLALHRQAVGLAQHHSMDVFQPLAALFPLQDISTLDELATELFGI